MTKHFDAQLDKLRQMILTLAGEVQRNIQLAIDTVQKADADLAFDVLVNDTRIDKMEVEIEEECLHTLALYQPVARDLRLVTSVLTIAKDLERMGDLSVNLGEQARFLATEPGPSLWLDSVNEECSCVLRLVQNALQAFVETDATRARGVLQDDDEVDRLHRRLYTEVKNSVRESSPQAEHLFDLLMASRQLERIGDHAVNIAEDVVYLVEGDLVRRNQLRH